MRKNEIIALLLEIEGNPEIVIANTEIELEEQGIPTFETLGVSEQKGFDKNENEHTFVIITYSDTTFVNRENLRNQN